MGKNQAFTLPIYGNGKALEVGAWCLISSTFLYLSGVIHLIGRCLIGEVLRYICIVIKNQCPENVISVPGNKDCNECCAETAKLGGLLE